MVTPTNSWALNMFLTGYEFHLRCVRKYVVSKRDVHHPSIIIIPLVAWDLPMHGPGNKLNSDLQAGRHQNGLCSS
jgi:hypothetical protein